MRVTYGSRRSRSTTCKIKPFKFRAHLMTCKPTKLSQKIISKPKSVLCRLSTWMNRWTLVQLIMLFICILIHYRSALININNINIKSMYQPNNKTFIKHEYINWIHYDWCSSSSHFLNNTSSYTVTNQSVILSGLICCIMLIIGLLMYFNLKEKLINDSSSYFWYGLLMLALFIGSSICNQWFSSLACRPVEILYDKRFTSMIGVQMIGFIVCLQLAYTLGSIFTPLFDQVETTSSKLDSIVPLFPPIETIS